MALPQGALSKLIEILNDRDKRGPGGPGKPVTAYQGGKTPTPTGRSNEFNYAGGLDSYLQEAARRGLDVSNVQSAEDLQGRIYDSLMASKEGQGIIKNMWKDYGDTLKGSGKVLPENLSEQDLAELRSSFVDNKLGGRTQMVLGAMQPPTPPQPPPPTQPERRRVTDIVDKVMGKSKFGENHGIGLVYQNYDLEFDPKYGYRKVPGSEYNDVVMFPEDSEYMQTEGKQLGELPADVAERYRQKYNAKNIVRGKSSGEGYGEEYAKQLRSQRVIK